MVIFFPLYGISSESANSKERFGDFGRPTEECVAPKQIEIGAGVRIRDLGQLNVLVSLTKPRSDA